MKFIWKFVVLFLLVTCNVQITATEQDLIVKTKQGPVKGIKLISIRSNETFYAYMGIPYAKPPTGDLRFKAPEAMTPWSEVRNATIEGSVCPQINPGTGRFEGNEDCLFLNVYTPQMTSGPNNTLYPVMIWIHGGDYLTGSGNRNTSGPDYIVDQDVVMVTFNYRIGILGFLSLDNEEVPGNNGMKDQVMVLKWVKENIDKFGGDPNKVTIFGEGSGASCVHYHMLSPMSRELFYNAISQSGNPLNPWGIHSGNSSIEMAVSLGKALGGNTTDTKDLLNCLRNAKPQDLVAYLNRTTAKTITDDRIGLTIDKNAGENIFLPDSPIKLTKDGKMHNVPYVIGVNNAEGLMIIDALERLEWLLEPVKEVFEKVLPYYTGQDIQNVHDMAEEIKLKYFNSTEPLLQQYVNVITDSFFVNQLYCVAKKQATISNSSVFTYLFSFDGNGNAYKKMYGGQGYKGAGHGDELPYQFRMDIHDAVFKTQTPEFITSSRLVKLWTNFAKTGNPTPVADSLLQNITWNAVTDSDFPYLDIDYNLKMKTDIFNGRPSWWEELYRKYLPNTELCWSNQ